MRCRRLAAGGQSGVSRMTGLYGGRLARQRRTTAELAPRRLIRLAPTRLARQARLRSADPMARWYPPHRAIPPTRQAGAYATSLLRPSAGPAARDFLVFAQGRTGSSLLVDLLNGSPDVHCDEEILARPVLLPGRWVAAKRSRRPEPVYGFKVKLYQLTIDQALEDPGGWLFAMHRDGWRVVHLRRRNLLRQVLSNVVASRNRRYRYRSEPAGAPAPIRVDPAEILHWMGVRERVGEAERGALARVPHERVCYEDDLVPSARHQATLDRLGAALRFEPGRATTTLRRINAGRLSDLVANHAELERALSGTRWEPHLD